MLGNVIKKLKKYFTKFITESVKAVNGLNLILVNYTVPFSKMGGTFLQESSLMLLLKNNTDTTSLTVSSLAMLNFQFPASCKARIDLKN
jgi:hypothetical protein